MDLVLNVLGGRRGEEVLRSCLIGLGKIEHDQLYVISDITLARTIPIRPPTCFHELGLLKYVSTITALSEDFIYVDDHTVIQSRYTPDVASNLGFLPRGKNEQALMIESLKFLMEHDLPTFDYETHLPAVFNKQKLLEMPDLGPCSVRTLYYNHLFEIPPARTDSAHIDIWSHHDKPQGPVVHLSDTALEHKQCRKWLERTFVGEIHGATGVLQ